MVREALVTKQFDFEGRPESYFSECNQFSFYNDNDFIHFLNMRHREYRVIQCNIYSVCVIQQSWLNT